MPLLVVAVEVAVVVVVVEVAVVVVVVVVAVVVALAVVLSDQHQCQSGKLIHQASKLHLFIDFFL